MQSVACPDAVGGRALPVLPLLPLDIPSPSFMFNLWINFTAAECLSGVKNNVHSLRR